ncbi:hypothetical protein BD626DRAFT_449021 [Schizophyllum amplum]|uniref:Protein kinase domain-containing protein n=1 Tax=Schizophyllum amplum TaxID=97359 RepID=A0A550D095_9AGAR|nr:hypothetical protein BD626DRAFT_449021 [Auriculariopsis ampla]
MPTRQPSTKRVPIRIDPDAPWSVSVAETPNDAAAYSIYVKTPTHNLTLTRTAMEIVELDTKLREGHPGLKLPPLPLDPSKIPAPPKRKSTFLNTLSRLASPATNRTRRSQNASTVASTAASNVASPLASPSAEPTDPFLAFSPTNQNGPGVTAAPSTLSTGLASYLTTISNVPDMRQARPWKRFIRVRMDDLESVRVERAIKRVRSDLAAHGTMKDKKPSVSAPSDRRRPSIASSKRTNGQDAEADSEDDIEEMSIHVEEREADIQEEAEHEVTDASASPGVPSASVDDAVKNQASVKDAISTEDEPASASPAPPPKQEPAELTPLPPSPTPEAAVLHSVPKKAEAGDTAAGEEDAAATPTAENSPLSRIRRAKSADPDQRMSRAFGDDTASSVTGDESATGDEESTHRKPRKKRGLSVDPRKDKKSSRKVTIDDYEMMRVLGKGCAGKVLLVRDKKTTGLYALKAITKRHVLAHQELQHTLTEQAVLARMAAQSKDPFVVKLHQSFHDKDNLFLVMDFHPGGDLATQLARWGRLGRDRARFYAAEIVEGVEGLHAAGVIYRDLKPENILIGGDGHIVLTDFGLSKEFPKRRTLTTAPSTPNGTRGEFIPPASPPWTKGEKELSWAPGAGQQETTTTFCGTAEYLAPEVIQGLPYSYEVDWWSFGTMLYEMLTGITPFWANNHSDMYVRVLQDELQFPDDKAIDHDTKSLIRGLLQRNPALRLCEPRIKRHPYFSMIDWAHVYYKRYIPPYIPPIDPSNASDTQNFDDTFLDMEPVLDEYVDEQETDQEHSTDAERTDDESANDTPSQSRSSSSVRPASTTDVDETVDVFDGYSFKGRHSVLLDDDVEEDEEEESEEDHEGEEDEEEELDEALKKLKEEKQTDVEARVADEAEEPKTPEARPTTAVEPVPDLGVEVQAEAAKPSEAQEKPTSPVEPARPQPEATTAEPEAKPRTSKDVPAPVLPEKDGKHAKTARVTTKAETQKRQSSYRGTATRSRRERSGIPALDKNLPDDYDEGETTERDEEDDDWDFVEAVDGEDRNGAKGTSLFARGVVDRYRLKVFRKASTPSQRPNGTNSRSVSGMSQQSDVTTPPSDGGGSPSPSQRSRGRAPLSFRKGTKQFLKPKVPPPSAYSTRSSVTSRSALAQSNSGASTVSSLGALTPSPSGTLPEAPSLKSKESAMSVGDNSMSSDGGAETDVREERDRDPHKTKKLKKYKEGAEKMFSLFSSPRQGPAP